MGRRSAQGTKVQGLGLNLATASIIVPAVGFALEVAMVAAFLFWGFRQGSPWNLVLGIGVPALVVVLWGIFMAPRSARRLPAAAVMWASLILFLLAGAALIAVGAVVLGALMLVVAVAYFAAEWLLRAR